MKTLRLFLIGLCMGIADLIPGISGGTVAFLAGIYEPLLKSLQSIRLREFRKIAWPFLLPVGAGIGLTFLTLTPLCNTLLTHYASSTYAFFFGVIAASTVLFLKNIRLNKLWHWMLVAVGIAPIIMITHLHSSSADTFSFLFLVLSGMAASSAMLLPGVSGSYVLYLLGVYPVAIKALATGEGMIDLLMPLFLGIVIGLLGFSRVVSFCLTKAKYLTLSLLTGFMIGGLFQIWPFKKEALSFPIFFALIGFFLVMGMERGLRLKIAERRFKE